MSTRRDAEVRRLLDDRAAAAEDRRARLLAQLAELRAARDGASGDDEHDPEGETLSQRWSQLHTLLADAEGELAVIAGLRGAVARGGYGVCESCGEAIPFARLEALPTARLCVPCAERRSGARR